jgi:hypothetical protein
MNDDRLVASPDKQEKMAPPGSNSKTHPLAVSMDVLSLLRLIGRHWRVTVPAALLTLLGLVAALQVSSPTYNATGSIVLLSPPEAPEVTAPSAGAPPEVGQNPFNRYGDIAIVTNILTRIMNSDSKRAELAESDGVAGYEIVASATGRDPVFEVTGHGPDAPTAIAAAEVVLADASKSLSEVQQAQQADPDYFFTSASLEPPSEATAVYGSTMRMGIAALAFGGLCTLGVAVLAEVIGRRRADRQAASRPTQASAAAAEVAEVVGRNGSTEEGSGAPVGVVDAAGSNGSTEEGSGAPVGVVDAAGSDASFEEGSGAPVGVVDAAGSDASFEEGSGAPVGVVDPAGSDASFDSTRVVPEGTRRRVNEGGSGGSPAWGRAPAPLGRRPHRPPPNRSRRPLGNDGGTQPTADH